MATLSYIVCICCDISEEWVDFIHIWVSVIRYHVNADVCTLTFVTMPNVSNYGKIVQKYYVFIVIDQR